MTDRSVPDGESLRRALDSSVTVGVSEFADLVDGWSELDAVGEICGVLLLVRGADAAAAEVVAVLAGLADVLDVVGPVDEVIAGALVDVTDQDPVALAVELHDQVRARTGSATWVVATSVRAASRGVVLARGRASLDQALARRAGAVVGPDGAVVDPRGTLDEA